MISLSVGDTVVVAGLENRADLNGVVGEITSINDDERSVEIRWRAEDKLKVAQIRARNVKVIEQRPPPSFDSQGIDHEQIYKSCRVRIFGLQSSTHLNGLEATAQSKSGDGRWVVKLRSSDKWLTIAGKNLEVIDVSDENARRASKVWDYASINPSDPRWAIGQTIVREMGQTRLVGKVMKWHDYHIGASIRYEDGTSDFLPINVVKSMLLDPAIRSEALEAAKERIGRFDEKPILYNPPPPSPEPISTPMRKRRRRTEPSTDQDDSSLSSILDSGSLEASSSSIMEDTALTKSSAASSTPDRAATASSSSASRTPPKIEAEDFSPTKPVIYFNKIFCQHEGGGQDKGGKWLDMITRKLRRRKLDSSSGRTLSNSCSWIAEPFRSVTIEEVAATGVHSEDYLNDLQAVNQYINSGTTAKHPSIDLASQKCYSIIGRRRAEVPGECIMDKTTLAATLLRCAMTRDAFETVLSNDAPAALVLARPACHHVPFRLDNVDSADEGASSSNTGSQDSIKCHRCEQGDNERSLLVCDNPDCGDGWHSFCLPYSLGNDVLVMKEFRTGNWYCPECLGTPGRIAPEEAEACRLRIAVCQSRAKESPSPSPNLECPEDASLQKLPIGNEISLGFCFINAVAFAIKQMLSTSFAGSKIMILDVDVHHGNGNETAFFDDPRVLTFSIHRYGPDNSTGQYVMPGTGHHTDLGDESVPSSIGMNLNFEMHEGDGDREYVDVITRIVRPVIGQWQPDMMVFLCGFDAIDHSSAPTTFTGPGMDCKLSPEWFAWAYPYLSSIMPSGRIVACTEGGYNPESSGRAGWLLVDSIVAHLAAIQKDRTEAVTAATAQRPSMLPVSDFARQRSWDARLNEHISTFRSAGWNIPLG